MVSLISTGSNYIIVIMGVIYAITCFTVFLPSTEKRQVKRMDRQELFMFVFHFICYGVLFAKTLDTKIIFLYLAQVVFFKMLIFVYSRVYVDCSRILMNHTCFLLLIGFVMLTRLSFDKAVKQFIIAAATSLIVLFIPHFMEKAVWLKKLKWIYGLLGLIFLSSVFVIGTSQNGATNWISLGHGIALQPSEFVKISFVFFIAAMLTKAPNFKTMLLTSIFAACHVIILIGEKDLGGALIYFVVYVFLCYVATGRGIYLFGGIGAGTLAAKLAYMLFAHVRVRFIAWKDPWSDCFVLPFSDEASLSEAGASAEDSCRADSRFKNRMIRFRIATTSCVLIASRTSSASAMSFSVTGLPNDCCICPKSLAVSGVSHWR